MTDNDVIKALECCSTSSQAMCRKCPYKQNNFAKYCAFQLSYDALDLIKRQQAEIEQWKTLANEGKEKVELLEIEKSAMQRRIDEQQAEIDDLFYKLTGVMCSVDKWLEGDELKQDEVNRAATMREKTLCIVEKKQAEIEELRRELKVQTYDGKVENSLYYCAKGICQACHYNSERHDECMRRLIKDACEAGYTDEIIIENQRKTIGEQKTEIERLKRDRYLVDEKGRFELLPRTDIEEIKSEAYKELAERLYTYRTGISIKGEELMIIPMSDYEEILIELTGLKGSKSTGLEGKGDNNV